VSRPLLAIFPHPDDETFTAAGVMAAAVTRGVPVTAISTTRGESGESGIPGLDDPERLGAVREQELRQAMRAVGVTDVRLLAYRDSGMAGSPAATHPLAFIRAPIDEIAAALVPHIRSLRPGVVLTFGPEGLYGHPDHLHLHHAVLHSVAAAADPALGADVGTPWQIPRLYFAAFPREEMLSLLDRPGSPLASLPDDARANLGVPFAEITHTVDIAPWAEAKRAAIAAHRTQTGEGGPLAGVPPEVRDRQLAREHFVRAPLPWTAASDGDDIIAALAAERSPS
jgi:LmbE family N-acetylglucosaminyl deacetylase